MKNTRISSLFLFVMFFAVAGFTSCEKSDEDILQDPVLSLTEDEKTNLLFMREEEKMARDVYLNLYDKYELPIFSNIASSEQTHMDAVLTHLVKYGLTDPASNELGVFTNTTLQQLYNDLIAQGDASLTAALTVGTTIEDVDIRDLNDAIKATTKTDLIKMYEMLECGSRNHMRAFTKQLEMQGEAYTAQFITQDMYNQIINGTHESCGGN